MVSTSRPVAPTIPTGLFSTGGRALPRARVSPVRSVFDWLVPPVLLMLALPLVAVDGPPAAVEVPLTAPASPVMALADPVPASVLALSLEPVTFTVAPPELPPLAPSTVPTTPLELSLPVCPVAAAAPVVFVVVPVRLRAALFVSVAEAGAFPSRAPPLSRLTLPVSVMPLLTLPSPVPLAEPLAARAVSKLLTWLVCDSLGAALPLEAFALPLVGPLEALVRATTPPLVALPAPLMPPADPEMARLSNSGAEASPLVAAADWATVAASTPVAAPVDAGSWKLCLPIPSPKSMVMVLLPERASAVPLTGLSVWLIERPL